MRRESYMVAAGQLTAVHTPRHLPGHLCFHEIESGLLRTGDLFYRGTMCANCESTDPVAFALWIDRISRRPGVSRPLLSHHSPGVRPSEI